MNHACYYAACSVDPNCLELKYRGLFALFAPTTPSASSTLSCNQQCAPLLALPSVRTSALPAGMPCRGGGDLRPNRTSSPTYTMWSASAAVLLAWGCWPL